MTNTLLPQIVAEEGVSGKLAHLQEQSEFIDQAYDFSRTASGMAFCPLPKNQFMPEDIKQENHDDNREKETTESIQNGKKAIEVEKKIEDKSEESAKEDADKWRNEG